MVKENLIYMKKSCFAILLLMLLSISPLLGQVQDSSLTILKYNHFPANTEINQILVDKKNRKIVASSNGLYVIGDKNDRPNQLNSNDTKSIFINNQNEIIALTSSSILNINDNTEIQLPKSTSAFTSLIYLKGSYWAASNSGLVRIHKKTGKIRKKYTKKNSRLPSDVIHFLFVDKKERIWIGTDNGIAIYNHKRDRWKVYEKGYSMGAITQNSEGIWLVSNEEMWLINDYDRWFPAALQKGLKEGNIKDITTDKDGRLILASESIVRYNPYDEAIFSYSEALGFLSKKAQTLEGDMNQDIWIGTKGDGMYVLTFSDTKITPLSVLIEETKPIHCNFPSSGSLDAKVFGGKPPYTYYWNENGPSKKSSLKNIEVGKYNLVVTDANNNSIEARYILKSSYPIKLEASNVKSVSGSNSKDGQVSLVVSGGTTPYSIFWNKEANNNLNRKDLSYGNYAIKVVDALKCESNININVPKEKFIPELDMETIEVGQTLQINELYFEADSTYIMNQSFDVLNEVYEFLSQNPSVVIEIGGHTNNIPPKEYCYKLSTERAETVANFLIKKGIQQNRILYKGYGKDNPIADNSTLAGRKLNQRVEIKILSIE